MYTLEFYRDGRTVTRQAKQKRRLIKLAKRAMRVIVPECYATVLDEDDETVFEASGCKGHQLTVHVQ